MARGAVGSEIFLFHAWRRLGKLRSQLFVEFSQSLPDGAQAKPAKSISTVYDIFTQAMQAAVSVKIKTQPLVMLCWNEPFDALAQILREKERRQAFLCANLRP
jgi:hypothetical protein